MNFRQLLLWSSLFLGALLCFGLASGGVFASDQEVDEDPIERITVWGTPRNIGTNWNMGGIVGSSRLGSLSSWSVDTDVPIPIEEEECTDTQLSGNPVRNSDGRKVDSFTDVRGVGEFPLSFRRHYSSAGGVGWFSSFSRNWTSSVQAWLNVDSKTLFTEGKRLNFGGQEDTFDVQNLGISVTGFADSDERNILFEHEDYADTWVLRGADGVVWVFEEMAPSCTNGNCVTWAKVVFKGLVYQLPNRDEDGEWSAAGLHHAYSYDGKDIISVNHSNGQSLSFTYDAAGRPLTITDSANETIEYDYTLAGILEYVTYPNGDVTRYHYEDTRNNAYLTGISYNGVRFSHYDYDSIGRVLTSRNGASESSSINLHTFQHSASRTTVTNPLGHTTRFNYGSFAHGKRLTSINRLASPNCSSAAQSMTYNVSGGLARVVDWEGNATERAYDSLGRVVEVKYAAGTIDEKLVEFQWDAIHSSKLARQIETDVTYEYDYDALGYLTEKRTIADGAIETESINYILGTWGRISTVERTDSEGNTTRFHYNVHGNLTRTEFPDGTSIRYTHYDPMGRVGKVTNPDDTYVNYQYDSRGRVMSERYYAANGSELYGLHYSYNRFGRVASVERKRGSTIFQNQTLTYDTAGRLTRITSQKNNQTFRIQYTLDNMGNVTAERRYNPDKVEMVCTPDPDPTAPPLCRPQVVVDMVYSETRAYDELGRLIGVYGSNNAYSNTYQYDNNGRLIRETDGRGNSTQYVYNARGQLVETIDPTGKRTTMGYNDSQLSSVTDSRSNTTQYVNNDRGYTTGLQSPDTGISTMSHDNMGRTVSRTDARGVSTSFSYDSMGRLIQRTNGNTASFNYGHSGSSTGKLTSFSNTSGSTQYSYNAAGQMSQQTHTILGNSYATGLQYDAQGRLTQQDYGNVKITYSYDTYGDVNRINAIINGTTRTVLSNVTNTPISPVEGWTFGNGIRRSFCYDKAMRLSCIIDSSGPMSYNYFYDTAGNITRIYSPRADGYTRDFTYDALNRVKSVSGARVDNFQYTYDSLGNRTSLSGTYGEYYAYDGHSNQLQRVYDGEGNKREYNYDANGNVIWERRYGLSVRNYTYNDDNRMTRMNNTYYYYNAIGQRVRKSGGSAVATDFIYAPDGKLLAEGSNGQYTKYYIYFGNTLVGYISGSTLYYVHTDHLGRPEAITNASKSVVWRAEPTTFGTRNVTQSSIGAFNIGFPGQYWDQEKESWYNLNRDYNPETGRYLQSDPLGLADGVNTYSYVSSNPLIYTDYTGLSKCGCEAVNWPTNDKTITSGYSLANRNVQGLGTNRRHTALDIRSALGGPVYSIWSGVVSRIGVAGDAGNYIKVSHSNGFESSYSHTASMLSEGDSVAGGDQIGVTDLSGASTGPHLHFVLRDRNNNRIDPTGILNGDCPE